MTYKMGPKKARKNMRKTEFPTDTPREFKLGDTAADIYLLSSNMGARKDI